MKPPVTRKGRTHRMQVGPVCAYITVNSDAKGMPFEVFAKADNGAQGALDMVCRIVSLALQGRGDVATICRHMRHDQTEPRGTAGQPSSIFDALSQVLEREIAANATAVATPAPAAKVTP